MKRISDLRIMVVVLGLFLVSTVVMPNLVATASAGGNFNAAPAAAESAGEAAGAATMAGISTGTIAAAAAVAAVAAVAIASGGGGGSSSTGNAGGDAAKNLDAGTQAAVNTMITKLTSDDLSKLSSALATETDATKVAALSAALTGATAADVDDAVNATAGKAKLVSALGTKAKAIYDAIQGMKNVSAIKTFLNQIKSDLTKISAIASTFSSISSTELASFVSMVKAAAEDYVNTVKAILAVTNPNATVTTVHHGGGIYTTVAH